MPNNTLQLNLNIIYIYIYVQCTLYTNLNILFLHIYLVLSITFYFHYIKLLSKIFVTFLTIIFVFVLFYRMPKILWH